MDLLDQALEQEMMATEMAVRLARSAPAPLMATGQCLLIQQARLSLNLVVMKPQKQCCLFAIMRLRSA